MPKSIIKTPKPRNLLVAATRFRLAGRHDAGLDAHRRAGRMALKRELSTLELPRDVRSKPPSP